MRRVKTDINCPVCSKKLHSFLQTLQIPYFDEVLQSTIYCESCGYRSTDISVTSQKDPVAYQYKINTAGDMRVRVVRAKSAEICIPELGIEIHPDPRAESFVSNIEGVLERVKDVVMQAVEFAQDPREKDRGREVLRRINRIREGNEHATLVLRDRKGNSAILSPRAHKRPLKYR